jgi:phosphate transport system permease protein
MNQDNMAQNPIQSTAATRTQRVVAVSRQRTDTWARRVFFVITILPIGLIAGVLIGLLYRAWPILQQYPLTDLLFGVDWKPSEGRFGFYSFIVGTVWVTVVGVGLAIPPCILVAIYLAEYAGARTRLLAKPILDVLAAIPPVVYGVWGLLVVVPLVETVLGPWAQRLLGFWGLFAVQQPTGFSVLAGGIVLAIMITPLIIAVVFEIFNTVPVDLRNASLAVGATRWETIQRVLLPQVMPGIIAAIVLGASRAFGETIAVLMVVGNIAQVPHSLFDAAYPLPALIANNYGDMMSIPLYDAALLCAALILLVIILLFNILATVVLKRFVK